MVRTHWRRRPSLSEPLGVALIWRDLLRDYRPALDSCDRRRDRPNGRCSGLQKGPLQGRRHRNLVPVLALRRPGLDVRRPHGLPAQRRTLNVAPASCRLSRGGACPPPKNGKKKKQKKERPK